MSPLFIYLLGIIDSIKVVLVLAIIASILVCVFTFVFGMSGYEYGDREVKVYFKYAKISLMIFIISGLLQILTPNRNTLIAMYATKYITVDNIKMSKEVMIETIEEVMNIIKDKEER